MDTPTTKLAVQPAPQQAKLLEIMAQQYNLDGASFKNVLLKTVFPQNPDKDKPAASMEQLASFCAVAHEYRLNPLIREIYAFPAKGGGIIPIVSIDGWITMVQRHPQYNGHSFVHEWLDGKVGGTLISMTCLMRRKDREFAIENTEFMDECKRDTDPWKKWPSRMLRHKCFIQSARYAFGLSGIYDEDDAERIIEGEKIVTDNTRPAIQMPQRQQQLSAPATFDVPETVQAAADEPVPARTQAAPPQQTPAERTDDTQARVDEIDSITPRTVFPGLLEGIAQDAPDPAQQAPAATAQQETPGAAQEPQTRPGTIGPGKAKRIYAICNSRKTRTKQDFEEFKRAFKIEHLQDLPINDYPAAEKWAEGDK